MDPHAHTFGGSALDRHVFDFEAVADGGTAGVPAGADPSPTAPAAPAPAGGAQGGEPVSPPAGATGPAPAWSPEDPTFTQAVDDRALALIQQQFGPIAQLLEQSLAGDTGQQFPQQLQPGAQPGGPVQLDPFDESFGGNLAQLLQAQNEQMLAQVQQLIGQVAQPLNVQMEQQRLAAGNERLRDMVADDIARNGDFPRAPGETESKAQRLVQPLAEALFPEIAGRYGDGPRAAEIAIQQASQTVRAIIAEAGAAAVAAHQNQLGTLAGARGEPSAAALGAQGLPDTQDPAEITRRYAEAGRALTVATG